MTLEIALEEDAHDRIKLNAFNKFKPEQRSALVYGMFILQQKKMFVLQRIKLEQLAS